MTVPQEVQALYDAVLAILAQHNEAVGGESADGYVDGELFLKKLKASGGTTVESLTSLSLENLIACLPDIDPKPYPLASVLNKAVRKGKPEKPQETTGGGKGGRITKGKVEKLSLRECLEHFDPEDPTSPVGQRLNRECRGEPFLVYSTGRVVDVDRSLQLLEEIRQGYPGRTTFEGQRVYSIGQLPDNYADENPLYPGRPLRPGGFCDQLNRSWEGVSKEVRQFVRFALDYEGGIDPSDTDKAHNALNLAVGPDAMKKLRERYPDIAIEFDDAEKRGELPNLLIPLGQPVPVGDADDGGTPSPFPVGSG